MKVSMLLMAAGGSKRMGATVKQLLPWKDTTLINNAIHTALQTNAQHLKVVLGAHAAEIRKLICGNVDCCTCNDWEKGLGTSISYGVQNIMRSDEKPDKILIMLADQPFIDTAFLNLLIHTAVTSEKLIVATRYKGRAGVPAIFDKALFEALIDLEGDTGARGVIKKYIDNAVLLKNEEAERDVDTISDYQSLTCELFSRRKNDMLEVKCS